MQHTLVCLHGWGTLGKESFAELREALKDTDLNIISPDLPGFGSEPEPDKPWNTDDYADWVAAYINENVEGPYSLLGHSHGGRIIIKLLTRDEETSDVARRSSLVKKPEHIFLCASAGIRHPRHFKRIVGLTLAKTGKFLLSIPGLKLLQPLGKKLLYKLVRVHDYEKASPIMQQTLILVSKEDLKPSLHKIDVPTDIFWGTDDRMTPISDAYVMEREIHASTLHVYAGVRHSVHRQKAEEIGGVISKKIS